MKNHPVEILLSTYNGASYLPQLLASLAEQSCPGWCLLVRDDGSTDDTPRLLEEFQQQFTSRVEIIKEPGPALGPAVSFGRLMQLSTAPRVMFCDQDDVWLPEKVARTVEAFTELENRYGADKPLLLHSDLEVVDENLQPVMPSFWQYQHLNPANADLLERELMMNVVTGCASMANRALLLKALPVPQEAIMYDWWLALVASAFGHVGFLPQSLICYRQHAANSIGAKRHAPLQALGRALHALVSPQRRRYHRAAAEQSISRHLSQGQAFLERFGPELTALQYELLQQQQRLYDHYRGVRLYYMLRYGLLRTGLLRNLAIAFKGRMGRPTGGQEI